MKKILVQLDSDPYASTFDAVVAVDSGIDHLLQYASVTPENVRELVHGAMFTRGPQDLKNTAVFIGGANVTAGEALLAKISSCFFGPLRVSVLLDSNGCNTTAAAAVLAAEKHIPLAGTSAVVLGGTGPVGTRVARLLAREGSHVRLASRDFQRAQSAASRILAVVPDAKIEPFQTATDAEAVSALQDARIVVAAGAAGIELLSAANWQACPNAAVMIDLNAVPPVGIAGIQIMDKAVERQGIPCYGAIGVGGMKMKIHKAAIARLFEASDQILDAEQVFAIGRELAKKPG